MTRQSFVANVVTAALLGVLTVWMLWWWLDGVSEADLPSCVTETQVEPDCEWDADEQGNGLGVSFVVIGGEVEYRD